MLRAFFLACLLITPGVTWSQEDNSVPAGANTDGNEDRRQAALQAETYAPDPNGDPLTEEVTRLLKEQGLLKRQEEMGQTLLLMSRQAQFYTAVAGLMDVIGPDARIEVAPGQFMTFTQTTLGKRAVVADLSHQVELINAEMSFAEQKHAQRVTTQAWQDDIDREATRTLPAQVNEIGSIMLERARDETSRTMATVTRSSEEERQQAIVDAEEILAQADETSEQIVATARDAIDRQEREQLRKIEELEAQISALEAERSLRP